MRARAVFVFISYEQQQGEYLFKIFFSMKNYIAFFDGKLKDTNTKYKYTARCRIHISHSAKPSDGYFGTAEQELGNC
jgi:hypothetical protein